MMGGHIVGLEMASGHGARLAWGVAIKNFRQPGESPPIDAAHDTEINSGDVHVWRDEQIALVHVGMEESIRNRLTQESVHQTGSNGGHVMPSRDQSLTVGNLDAVNPLARKSTRMNSSN